jgi:hypothetical protein
MPLTKAKTAVLDINTDLTIGVNGLQVGNGGGNEASNTRLGTSALANNTTGNNNTAIGFSAMAFGVPGAFNTAVGVTALSNNTNSYHTAVGYACLSAVTGGGKNTAVGAVAGASITTGGQNTIVGFQALSLCETGNFNTAVGKDALFNTTTSQNTAVGWEGLAAQTTGNNNTAIGMQCLNLLTTFSSCAGLGAQAQVTGSNQVQLGNVTTTTYAYGAVQDRSDIRDKADVRDTTLGLEFVNALRPVDFKWDMREDYRPEAPEYVAKPTEIKKDATEEEKSKYDQDIAAYEAYVVLKDKGLEDSTLDNLTHDGSKKRNRFHHGLIAQEVKSVLDAKNIDFGGFQDHKIAGGNDVLSIGYVELIAPMIKAIQELSAEVQMLKGKLNP